MVLHTRRAEVIGDAADCDHERVVAEGTFRRDDAPLFIETGSKVHEPPGTVEAAHPAEAVPETMPLSLRQIVEFVPGHIHAAGGYFVKERLPQMRPRLFNERDVRESPAAQPVADPCDQFESARATTDHDDAMEVTTRGSLRLLVF